MENPIDLLKKTAPFNLLPTSVLETLCDNLTRQVYRKDILAYRQGVTELEGVDILESGMYETFFYDATENKRCIEKHDGSYCFGGISILLNRTKAMKSVFVKKGTVVYKLPQKDFLALCRTNERFFHHFTAEFGQKMLDPEFSHFVKKPASFESSYIAAEQLYSRKIEGIVYKDIVWVYADTPVYEAAKHMAEHRISCLFVKDRNNRIVGYVTDITLRDNVIAKQVDFGIEIEAVMDNPVVSIGDQAYLYEAILMMFATKTKYLLVQKEGDYVGFLSRNRLLSEQGQSPLVFIQSVKQAESIGELKQKWEYVPEMVNQLLGRGVNAEIINQVITTIADTISVKVIEKVIKEVGEPPAKFVFMVTGSEGRKEQTLKTDQDNAIIYEDKANEQRELVRAYFLDFAAKVSDYLNEIGFVYCTGGFMASNPDWTHSLSYWKRNYKKWIDETIPENAMKFSTFFDCRFLYGDKEIINNLKVFLNTELQEANERFFVFIAKNALQYEPPLTFFNTIRTTTLGKSEVFSVKKAMTPIVDLVRVYALKNKIYEENTGERLKLLKEMNVFTPKQYDELYQSYYYLMALRLKTQAGQLITEKIAPNNYIAIDTLTKIEKATLKEIFKTIQNFQTGIKVRFTNSLTG